MIHAISKLRQMLARFRKEENGAATLEFLLVIPGFMLLFTSAYEGGMMSTRHVMLERALDQTVRDVRIGRIPQATNEVLSERICEYAAIIPNCLDNLRLNMQRMNPRSFDSTQVESVECVDRTVENQPVVVFSNTGDNNDLMILVACSLFDPMIPTTGLGKALSSENGGAYALVATSSYVMEPFQ